MGDRGGTGVRADLLDHLADIIALHQDPDRRLYRTTDTGGQSAVPVISTDALQTGTGALLRYCLLLHLQ